VSFTYNKQLPGSLSVRQPFGPAWSQSYTHDTSKRLSTVVSPAGSFGYSYSSASLLATGLSLPNGSAITNHYDSVARLLSTALKQSGGSILNSHQYAYNARHERTSQTFTAGNFIDYTYDNAGQLQSATGKESGGGTTRLHEKFGYKYDAAGNLDVRTNNALLQDFSVDVQNQLTGVSRSGTLTVAGTSSSSASSVTVNTLSATRYNDAMWAKDGFTVTNGNNLYTAVATDASGRGHTNAVTFNLPSSPSYTYDNNGNLTGDGARTYDYDDENQLIRVTVSNAWKSEFTYDGKMRMRLRKEFLWKNSAWVQSGETRYVYDGMLVLQERDGNNVPKVAYTRGRDLSGGMQGAGGIGGLLARTDQSKVAPAHAFYHADGNGSITALANSQQVLVAKYHYDPFGNILSESGPLSDVNVYRFSSKEYHPASGFSYYGYRWYAANLQRWLNRDPLQEDGGVNLYRFVENNPIVSIDPFGLASADTITSAMIQCARANVGGAGPGNFVTCICLFAPDSDECEKKLGGCVNDPRKMADPFLLCTCLCKNLLSDPQAQQDCIKACKESKRIKDFTDKQKKQKPPEPDIPCKN